jgi:hypothetical protein
MAMQAPRQHLGPGDPDRRGSQSTAPNTRAAFRPPNPNEVDRIRS